MVWWLFGTKPLPEPVLTYYQLNPWEQTSMKFESKQDAFENAVFKIVPFSSGLNVLKQSSYQFWGMILTHWRYMVI